MKKSAVATLVLVACLMGHSSVRGEQRGRSWELSPFLGGMNSSHLLGDSAEPTAGLRIGYIVAARELIREARRLRQMMIGRPSIINQRTAAFFLSLGHYDAFMTRLHKIMGERWDALRQALNHYHRGTEITHPTQGGTALWVESPDHVDVQTLVEEAAKRGILVEPDTHYYSGHRHSQNYFRMGVTSIPKENIREGINKLEQLFRELSGYQVEVLDPKNPTLLTGEKLRRTMTGATILIKTY